MRLTRWFDIFSRDVDIGAEAHNWYDCWLKGIDNGIMNESPVGTRTATYFFDADQTGSLKSINDGRLTQTQPGSEGEDVCRVDDEATTGLDSRWNTAFRKQHYPDRRETDARGLTYTTALLEGNLTIVAPPVVDLWLQADIDDVDVFARLETVDQS